MKDIASGVIGGIAGAIITLVINWLVDIPVLKSNVGDLRNSQKDISRQIEQINTKITDINQNYSRIAQFLTDKLHYNFAQLVKFSNQKNLSSQEFQKAATMLEKNSSEAENYLIKDLNFTPDEFHTVRSFSSQKK
jgi:methyl-accepting chemotaxis protein